MADIKKPGTIDTDAALASDDPQSQVASQGWGYIDPLGKAYGALKEGQQNARQFDNDLSGSVQSMTDLSRTGVASNPDADMALAAHTNGMAMGTLKGEDKPLPMDEASRLARAKEMGFDTGVEHYHGTGASIDEFKTDVNKKAANRFLPGVYTSSNPSLASGYSMQGPGSNVMPVVMKGEGYLNIEEPNALDHLYDALGIKKAKPDRFMAKRIESTPEIGNVELLAKSYAEHNGISLTKAHQELPKELLKQGIRGFDIPSYQIRNTFDPTDIRSKFAEFNPKKAKSGKLSYAEGGEVQHYDEGTPMGGAQPSILDSPEAKAFAQGPTQGGSTDSSILDSPELAKEFAPELKEAKYGTTGQQFKAGLEGAAQGVAGPLAPLAEKHLLGVDPEDIRARAEVNPGTHFAGEVGGLLAPAIISGGASLAGKAGFEGAQAALQGVSKLNQASLLEGVGSAVAKKLAPTSLAGKIGTGAAKAAVENMLLGGSDETSKMILNDPSASAHNAIASVALSGLLGGALGGTMSGLGGLFDSKLSGRTGQMIADFKGRISQHIETPDPVKTMHEELSSSLAEMDKVADDTFGANGIKADAISKLVPKEVTPEIAEQFTSISDKLDSSLNKLSQKSDPHAGLLEDKIAKFKEAANSQDTGTMFNAIQDLKQQLQAESRYTEGLSPLSERAYRSTVKSLAHDLRTSLEDSKVWGDAGHVQAEINGAASKYFPAIKDFKSLMTTKVMGVPQIDPGKIQTYLNQLGKANAEIKQVKMQNFVDNADMFKAAVNKAYERVGIESPIQPTPMNYTLSTLGEKTPGSKLADILIHKLLTDAGSKAAGAAVGGGLGLALVGHGEIAALIGAHVLGPFFKSVMPAIAQSVLKIPVSGTGFKAAVNYATAAARGESLMSQATKNIFRLGSEVLPQSYMPTEKDRTKLQKVLDKLKVDPSPLLNAKNDVGHYLPDHSTAVNATAMTAINYLNSLKPDQSRKAPLDAKPVLSSVTKAKYDNAMNIAEQPMIVLDKLQKGTLNQNDMEALNTMYPALYNRMKTKVLGEIVNAQTKGKPVPYKTRTALSLFMGQPIDSTLLPSSIQSMQPVAQGNQQQPQGNGSQPAPKRSTASLSKMGGMYKTPDQTAAGRRQREN